MHPSGAFCVDWNSILSETWEDGLDGVTLEFRGPRSLDEAEQLEEIVQRCRPDDDDPQLALSWHRPLLTSDLNVVVSMCHGGGKGLVHWLRAVSQVATGKLWVDVAERIPGPVSLPALALAFVPMARDDEVGPSKTGLCGGHLRSIAEVMVRPCMDGPGKAVLYDPVAYHHYPVERDQALDWLIYQAGRGRSASVAVVDDHNQVQRSATFDLPVRLCKDAPNRGPAMASIAVHATADHTGTLDVLLEHLPAIATRSHHAFIKPVGGNGHLREHVFLRRPVVPWSRSRWPSRATSWMPDHPHLIPDVHGIQVLTDRQVRAAADLSDWDVSEIAPDRHVVRAHRLDSWLDPDGPPPDVLDAARKAFGPDVVRMTNGR